MFETDLNLAVIAGRLCAAPEVLDLDSGDRLARLLITTTSGGNLDHRARRVDVLPIVCLESEVDDLDDLLEDLRPGDRMWVSGRIVRRFWDHPAGRRSRLEILAEGVSRRAPQPEPAPAGGGEAMR